MVNQILSQMLRRGEENNIQNDCGEENNTIPNDVMGEENTI